MVAIISAALSACSMRIAIGSERMHPMPRIVRQTHITRAFFPYDPPHGVYGFFRVMYGQTYDTWVARGRSYARAKAYETDFHGMFAFMIYTTDPDADIAAYEIGLHGALRPIWLKTMEATSDHKVVYINTANERKEYHRVIFVVTSPHPERVFYFSIFGDPDSGFD